MCNEILISPTSPYGRCLIKVLPHCGVVGGDQANLKLIHSLVEQIIEEVTELLNCSETALKLFKHSYSIDYKACFLLATTIFKVQSQWLQVTKQPCI